MRALPALLAIVLCASGCTSTRYVDYTAAEDDLGAVSRTVAFDIDDAYYQEPPTCIAPLPSGEGSGPLGPAIEDAMIRHLGARVGRVIDRDERSALEHSLGLDLSSAQDHRAFTRAARCSHLLVLRPWRVDRLYLLVWNRERVGIEAQLIRARDGRVVWRARHAAQRSEGGVPLSPFTALYSAAEAARSSADADDVMASLLDDAARRMAVTMPSTRGQTAPKIANSESMLSSAAAAAIDRGIP